ncbi:MAG: lipoyl(octanoyl) transferase LipB [Mariprofundaceae bacterium]
MSAHPLTIHSLHVIRHKLQAYEDSVAEQEAWLATMLKDNAPPCLILTEHTPVYTIGTSGQLSDVRRRSIDGTKIEVIHSGRGGEVTYHGPGQLVCYVLADLRQEQNLHQHVWRLEELIIRVLAHFDVAAGRCDRGIGVWVGGAKIAAVGVRCRRWISYHGVALNINPNLAHFKGIVPCGMAGVHITSMHALGVNASRDQVESELTHHAGNLFQARGTSA